MRLTNKQTIRTNNYKARYFSIKKDRKQGLIVTSPRIDWSSLSEEDQRIQWGHNINYLWECEKEKIFSREDILPSYYKVLELAKFSSQDISKIRSLKEYHIPFSVLSAGFLILHGSSKYKPGLVYFLETSKRLVKLGSTNKKTESKKELVSIKDSPLSLLIDEIMGLEDLMFKKKVNWPIWINNRNITKDLAQQVIKFYIPRIKEVIEIRKGTCEQLNEAYRNYNNKQKIHMLSWYTEFLENFKKIDKVIEKKQRIRKSRVKTSDRLVKKLKYTKEFLDYKSINPEKIIGSEILWCYNVKTRKLIYYQAKDGYTLSVSGASLTNWDNKKSYSKTIRKPEIQIKELLERGKKLMLGYFSSIKSVNSTVSGRINSDIILLRVT